MISFIKLNATVAFKRINMVCYLKLSETSNEYTRTTEDPCYNDSVCFQRFCCKIEFAVMKKLDMDVSKA